MDSLWYLLTLLLISTWEAWAGVLVLPGSGELSGDETLLSPEETLTSGARAAISSDLAVSSSKAVIPPMIPTMSLLPLFSYSVILAIIGFISVRIARWRHRRNRTRRPATLALEDEAHEQELDVLPTNTSELSSRFRDLPVPPPLSPAPASPFSTTIHPTSPYSHSRAPSLPALPHTQFQTLIELDRPKSPVQLGLSSPGSRRKSKGKRSRSVGPGSSPLRPSKRRFPLGVGMGAGGMGRPFSSDPETETETDHEFDELDPFSDELSERSHSRSVSLSYSLRNDGTAHTHTHSPTISRLGTLIDLSHSSLVPELDPVSRAPSDKKQALNSDSTDDVFGSSSAFDSHVQAHTRRWEYDAEGLVPVPASTNVSVKRDVPVEEMNLIDFSSSSVDSSLGTSLSKEPVNEHAAPVLDSVVLPAGSVSELVSGGGNVSVKQDAETEVDEKQQYEGEGKDEEGLRQLQEQEREEDVGWGWGFESVTASGGETPNPWEVQLRTAVISEEERENVAEVSMEEGEVTTEQVVEVDGEEEGREVVLTGLEDVEAVKGEAAELEVPLHEVDVEVELEDEDERQVPVVSVDPASDDDVVEDGMDEDDDNSSFPRISRSQTSLESEMIGRIYVEDEGEGVEGRQKVEVEVEERHESEYREDTDDEEGYERDERADEEEEEEDERMVEQTSVEVELGKSEEPEHENLKEEKEDEDDYPDPELMPLPEPELLTLPLALSESLSVSAWKGKEKEDAESISSSAPMQVQTQVPTPPASPPALRAVPSRRAMRRRADVDGVEGSGNEVKVPAWSVRAAVAPPLGLAASTSSGDGSVASSASDERVGRGDSREVKEMDEKQSMSLQETEKVEEERENKDSDKEGGEDVQELQIAVLSPALKTATLPGAFPVDSHPLSDVAAESTSVESHTEGENTLIRRPSSSSSSTSSANPSSSSSSSPSSSPSSTELAKQNPKPKPRRSPIDIALAMQLRPGLGPGADPAWMVRFLMAMFGWFVVLISGSEGVGGGPYVGIRSRK